MPSFHPSYIEKSNENWACVENLLKQASRFPNVIASRMYYSMFQLVKNFMLYNHENNIDCNKLMKMTDDKITGAHSMVLKCISYMQPSLAYEFRELWDLRVRADYEKANVTREDIDEAYLAWNERRKQWIETFIKIHRLIP
jgi:hypothetical protein